MSKRTLLAIALLFSSVLALTILQTASAAKPAETSNAIVVSGNTYDAEKGTGWLFNRDPGNVTEFAFAEGNASIGAGSLYVKPIGENPSDKMIAENFLNVPIADVTSIAYDYKISGNGNTGDASDFYLNVYVNINSEDNYFDCRFDYVPSLSETEDISKYQTANFLTSSVPERVAKKGTRIDVCPATLAEMPPESYIHFISVNVGQSNNSDEGLAGYLDNVFIGGPNVRYDFEAPKPLQATTKDECKNGGWTGFQTAYKNQGQCVSSVAKNKN